MPQSPSAAPRSVDPTMSVNSTVASTESRPRGGRSAPMNRLIAEWIEAKSSISRYGPGNVLISARGTRSATEPANSRSSVVLGGHQQHRCLDRREDAPDVGVVPDAAELLRDVGRAGPAARSRDEPDVLLRLPTVRPSPSSSSRRTREPIVTSPSVRGSPLAFDVLGSDSPWVVRRRGRPRNRRHPQERLDAVRVGGGEQRVRGSTFEDPTEDRALDALSIEDGEGVRDLGLEVAGRHVAAREPVPLRS